MPRITARFRFAVSIASADWSYATQQEVTIGEDFTMTTIPASVVPAWLAAGHIERVPDDAESAIADSPETALAPPARARRGR